MESSTKALFTLHLRQFTGKITFKEDTSERIIWMRKGIPVAAESNVPYERLGQLLLQSGRIDSETLDRVLEHGKMHGRKQGDVLIELGVLSSHEVYEALCAQTLTRLNNCLGLTQPDTHIDEGPEHLENITEYPVNMSRVMLDHLSLELSLSGLPELPLDKAAKLNEQGLAYLKNATLSPSETRLVRNLDGRRSLGQLFAGIEGDELHLLVAIFRGLRFVDLVELPSRAPDPQVPPTVSTSTQEAPPERKVIVIEEKKQVSPIYTWALKCKKNLADVLDARSNSTKIEIKKHYDQIVKDLKLDHIHEVYQGEEASVAQQVFDRITLALVVLNDDKTRMDYFTRLKTHQPEAFSPETEARVCRTQSALLLFRKHWSQAKALAERAISLMPESADYHVDLAEILVKEAHAQKTELPALVKEHLSKALQLDPKNLNALYLFGTVYKLEGNLKKAVDSFQTLLSHSPNHAPANSELRVLRKRLEQEEKKEAQSQLFGGIFSKKKPKDET